MVRLADLKEGEKKGYGFKELEEKSKLSVGSGHKVIPSREELSKRIALGEVQTKYIGEK